MRLGLGIGLGCGASGHLATLIAVDFTAVALGPMVNASFVSAFGISFARASVATVQTSASAVDSTPTADQPRFGYDGTNRGLVLEESRQNVIPNSRNLKAAGWAGGSGVTTAAYATGPDGTASSANRCNLASGQTAPAFDSTLTAATYTASQWFRTTGGGAGQQQAYLYNGTSGAVTARMVASSAAWARQSFAADMAAAGDEYDACTAQNWVSSGGGNPGAIDNLIDLTQVEVGAFATEAIVTSGSAATRAGERLYAASGSPLLSAGRLGLEIVFAPKGARSAYGANCELWHDPATGNEAFVDPTTGKVSVTIGGTTYTTSSGVTWAANDAVKLWLEAGGGLLNTVAKASVNGAVTTLGTSGSPQGSLSVAGELDLACSGTTKQLTSRIASIAAYRSGSRPAWAA